MLSKVAKGYCSNVLFLTCSFLLISSCSQTTVLFLLHCSPKKARKELTIFCEVGGRELLQQNIWPLLSLTVAGPIILGATESSCLPHSC